MGDNQVDLTMETDPASVWGGNKEKQSYPESLRKQNLQSSHSLWFQEPFIVTISPVSLVGLGDLQIQVY